MLAAAVGIGLRSVHVADVIATRPAVAWLEVHAENYMASGGPTLAALGPGQVVRRAGPPLRL